MKIKDIKVGAEVYYYPIKSVKTNYSEQVIDSEAYTICGAVVCRLKGKSGCFALDNLELREDRKNA